MTRTQHRDMSLLMAAGFLYSLNFGLLLPVTPVLIADEAGGGAAGQVNTALLIATVAAQWLSPTLLQRATKRHLYIGGLLLMGLPSIIFAADDASVWVVFAAATLRGFGFGLLTVVGAALVIELAPPAQRGATLGRFGLAMAVPGFFAPSLGLELLQWSALAPALMGLGTGVLGVVLLLMVREIRAGGTLHGYESMPKAAVLHMLADPDLRGLALAFMLVSVAWGGTVSFLPLALPVDGLGSASTFLFVYGLMRAVFGLVAGRLVDKGSSPVSLSAPAVVLTAFGLVMLAVDSSPVMVVLSAMVYGIGLGLLSTLLLLAIVHRNTYGHSAASALWAMSLDLGGVLGISCLGAVAAVGGYGAVLWTMPAIVLLAVPLLVRRWQHERARATESTSGVPATAFAHPSPPMDPRGHP